MTKKKKFQKKNLKNVLNIVNYFFSIRLRSNKYNNFLFMNVFRISTSFKQLVFSLLNTSLKYTKLLTTGQILQYQTKRFKFFKKSNFNINPLVLTMRFSYMSFFKNLYLIESLNYSKKQYLFFKKFISSVTSKIKFILFKKTWQYTTQPVKRIKRRVRKLLKNI